MINLDTTHHIFAIWYCTTPTPGNLMMVALKESPSSPVTIRGRVRLFRDDKIFDSQDSYLGFDGPDLPSAALLETVLARARPIFAEIRNNIALAFSAAGSPGEVDEVILDGPAAKLIELDRPWLNIKPYVTSRDLDA